MKLWAITWKGLKRFIIVRAKTAGEAYEEIHETKPPFGECKFLSEF